MWTLRGLWEGCLINNPPISIDQISSIKATSTDDTVTTTQYKVCETCDAPVANVNAQFGESKVADWDAGGYLVWAHSQLHHEESSNFMFSRAKVPKLNENANS